MIKPGIYRASESGLKLADIYAIEITDTHINGIYQGVGDVHGVNLEYKGTAIPKQRSRSLIFEGAMKMRRETLVIFLSVTEGEEMELKMIEAVRTGAKDSVLLE